MTTTFPPEHPDELLALLLGEAYDLFDDELLGDGTWDGHVLHVIRTFATPELVQIGRRLRELADDPRTDRAVEHVLTHDLGASLGPWQADLRVGLAHTLRLLETVLRERSESR